MIRKPLRVKKKETAVEPCLDAYLEMNGRVTDRDELLHRLDLARALAAIYWLGLKPATAAGPRRYPEPWRFTALEHAARSSGLL